MRKKSQDRGYQIGAGGGKAVGRLCEGVVELSDSSNSETGVQPGLCRLRICTLPAAELIPVVAVTAVLCCCAMLSEFWVINLESFVLFK